MNRKTLARPYAKAVFSHMLEKNSINRFSKIIEALKLLSSDADIVRIYKINKDSVIKIILDSLSDIIPELSSTEIKYLKSFIGILVKNKRFQLLGEIAELYNEYLMSQKSILPLEIVSAWALKEEEKHFLMDLLKQKFCKSISVRYRVETTLVAGFLVRSSEWTLDYTAKEKLRHLTKILSK